MLSFDSTMSQARGGELKSERGREEERERRKVMMREENEKKRQRLTDKGKGETNPVKVETDREMHRER